MQASNEKRLVHNLLDTSSGACVMGTEVVNATAAHCSCIRRASLSRSYLIQWWRIMKQFATTCKTRNSTQSIPNGYSLRVT